MLRIRDVKLIQELNKSIIPGIVLRKVNSHNSMYEMKKENKLSSTIEKKATVDLIEMNGRHHKVNSDYKSLAIFLEVTRSLNYLKLNG
ncbi:MAG: hypothetical protein AVO38_00190 [delta proteobacterium ML8_D]|jgi:hypothetical protein|nr:MAG: hypothetical protein AVO38_00190 [delta proteobacterium ML8_D]